MSKNLKSTWLVILIMTYPFSRLMAGDFSPKNHLLEVGVGFGYMYGGLAGGKILISPQKNVSLAVAYGVNPPTDPGYNFELRIKAPMNQARFVPHLNFAFGAYGNIDFENNGNTVISKTYSGPMVGVGSEIVFGNSKKNSLDLNAIYMIYRKDFTDDIDAMQALGSEMEDPSLFKLSVGYHRKFF